MNELTIQENKELEKNEAIIEKGQKTFYEVGTALKQIRDKRLYRVEFKTFAEYCSVRWGFEKAYANRLLSSSTVIDNLAPIGAILPKTETQARPLTSLQPQEQCEVWERVVDEAPDGKITALFVEEVVKEYKEEKKQEEKIKPKVISKFNETNDNIEWAKWTWNPVTGCKHDCTYCYARDISNRFDGNFEPKFHDDRLAAPGNTTPDVLSPGGRNVFVCSMADLFGSWVPNDWIYKIMEQVASNPQWTFLFLTKNPRRYKSIQFPENAWIGTSVDTQKRVEIAERYMEEAQASVKFLSCEPMLEPLKFNNLKIFDWIIIGARSRTTTGEEFQPEFRWVHDLTCDAWKSKCKVYWKPNLKCRPVEYPENI